MLKYSLFIPDTGIPITDLLLSEQPCVGNLVHIKGAVDDLVILGVSHSNKKIIAGNRFLYLPHIPQLRVDFYLSRIFCHRCRTFEAFSIQPIIDQDTEMYDQSSLILVLEQANLLHIDCEPIICLN